jgi:hypothetical protein
MEEDMEATRSRCNYLGQCVVTVAAGSVALVLMLMLLVLLPVRTKMLIDSGH